MSVTITKQIECDFCGFSLRIPTEQTNVPAGWARISCYFEDAEHRPGFLYGDAGGPEDICAGCVKAVSDARHARRNKMKDAA